MLSLMVNQHYKTINSSLVLDYVCVINFHINIIINYMMLTV